jgi:hypothetical protein
MAHKIPGDGGFLERRLPFLSSQHLNRVAIFSHIRRISHPKRAAFFYGRKVLVKFAPLRD